jgi:hypothetical protein
VIGNAITGFSLFHLMTLGLVFFTIFATSIHPLILMTLGLVFFTIFATSIHPLILSSIPICQELRNLTLDSYDYDRKKLEREREK